MQFVSFRRFTEDIAAWERQLPEFDAVCGIPRSGLIPAAYVALRRNVPHLNLSDLLESVDLAFDKAKLRPINPAAAKPRGSRILVVDDSTSPGGHTINQTRQRLGDIPGFSLAFGAVYCGSDTPAADYTFRRVGMPRMFEWNWFRHSHMSATILDIDGVLCQDWLKRNEQDVDPEYVQHLENAAPLWLPQKPVLALATSRLERYRPQTERWLEKHGVRYKHLYMHPASSPGARRAASDHAMRKAEAYRKHSGAMLFVESDANQAAAIHRLTRRPVLCTDTMQMHT